MGFLDFLFGKNKDEQTKTGSSIYQSAQKPATPKPTQSQAKPATPMSSAPTLEPFVFKSDCHQRFENGSEVRGLQQCIRTVSVEKNTNGCRGYKLTPGDGYIVKVFNDDLGKPNMSDKPMRIVSKTADKVELRGFPIEAQTPFGWQEVDYRDYGFTVYYTNGKVSKCVLHMFDRNVDLEYRKSDSLNNSQPANATTFKRWTKPVSHDMLFKRSISFHVERYEEWQRGQCTAKGQLNFDLHLIASQNSISVRIPNASSFRMHDTVSFDYVGSDILRDRIQYVNAPGASEDPTRPIILHIFVKNGKIDCIRFAMSFPDRIIEFYGYQIESDTSKESSISEPTVTKKFSEDYKLTFLSSLLNVAACDGEIVDAEMQTIMAYIQREGLSEADLVRVMTNPASIPNSIPNEANLRAQHLRDVVTLSMVDGQFHPKEYALCKQIAIGLGFRPDVIDIIRQELNDQIGADI